MGRHIRHRFGKTAIAALVLAFAALPAGAQVPGNCTMETLSDPARHVLRCAGGLVIEMSEVTQLGIAPRGDGPPSRVTIRQGAVLIEVEGASQATQIRTPHAIAAVRGTVYAVDVAAGSTAVFVVSGRVGVRQLRGPRGQVVLEEGQGVDVTPAEPLEVKTWGEARVRRLLSRFGR